MDARKKISILFILIVLLIVVGLGIFLTLNFKKNSGLQIDTLPKATVLLNDKEVGTTPYYQEGLPPGEAKLKLVALDPALTNAFYETSVKLTPGALTMVSRVFDNSVDYTSGQIDYLVPNSLANSASLVVISDPEEALVKIDGEDKGLTPINIKNLRAGSHEIVVVKPGFNAQPVNGRLENGYELNISVKLGKTREQMAGGENITATKSAEIVATQSAKTTNAATSQKLVMIKETGTGFLRVRSEPSLAAKEIGRVKPGDELPYLETDKNWVRIKFGTDSGWINQTYAQIVNP